MDGDIWLTRQTQQRRLSGEGEQVMSHVYDTHEITHAATLDMSSRDSKFALSTAAAHFPPP